MNTRLRAPALALALFAAAAPACGSGPASAPPERANAPSAPAPAASNASPVTMAPASTSLAASAAAPQPEVSFRDLVTSLSEPDGPFFSDNVISNETSYLQIAAPLARAATPGGAYIGVGPEQNFTYIALSRPKVAFILDIRRQNLIEQLLYKAIFEEASSRAHFLALLVGRPHEPSGDPGAQASIDQVIAHAEKLRPDAALFAASHARLRERIERAIPLSAADRKTLETTHRSFFDKQLDIRFELHEKNGRLYPTLRELLSQRDPEGAARGFLATEEAFRFVQQMEREGRIVPVVGDFAGARALRGIAAHLKKEKLTVSVFYVSNVEQYLFEPGVWPRWAANVAALPADDKSLFLRAYLDQGKRHPRQMKGHRAASVLQRIADFNERQAGKPFTSFWSVTTERVLGDDGAAL